MAKGSANSFLSKAREELVTLEILVDDDRIVEWIVGLHAQQIAEKVLKAVLIFNGTSPRKVHDLFSLMDDLKALNIQLPAWSQELEQLNPFAVLLRYETVDLAANWNRQEVKALVVSLYDWGAGEMGQPPYEESDDFENSDEGDQESGLSNERGARSQGNSVLHESQTENDFDNVPF